LDKSAADQDRFYLMQPTRIGPMRRLELVIGTGRRQEATMPEPDRNGISARLWRLPGQLLLVLINATSVVVIVAAILTLIAIARINHFAENFAATMTEAVLSKVDLPSKGVLTNLRSLTAEVRTLGDSLREIKAGENPSLQFEMTQLKEALTILSVSVDRIGSARSVLTDEAIGQLGRRVADTLVKLRDCSSNVGQIPPHRALSNQTVEASETGQPP
jgi:hypothetical protein